MKSNNNDITRWDLPDGAIARFGQGNIHDIALSPDGESLAVATSIGLWWYEVATMSPIAVWDTPERRLISAVAISADGQLAATGNGDGVIKVWDIPRSTHISEMIRQAAPVKVRGPYRTAGINGLAFSPDTQHLAATGIRDDIVYTWCPETGAPLAKFPEDDTMFSEAEKETRFRVLSRPIAFSPDNRLLASTGPPDTPWATDAVVAWDLKSGQHIAKFAEHPNFINSLCFSPCSRYLAIGGSKGTVQVWDVNTWQERQGLFRNYGVFRMKVFYSRSGVFHAMMISRDAVIVWDVESSEKRYTAFQEEEDRFQDALVSNRSQCIVASTKAWRVQPPGEKPSRKFLHSHTSSYPNSIVFSLDGKRVATGYRRRTNDGGIRLWNVERPSQQPAHFRLPGDKHSVSVCGAEQKIRATGFEYYAKTVQVWDVEGDLPPLTFTHPDKEGEVTAAGLASEKNRLACGDNRGRLYVWDLTSGALQQVVRHALVGDAGEDYIKWLVFSQDGEWLVSTTNWGCIAKLWNLDRGEEIPEFLGEQVYSLAFSPCGGLIARGMFREVQLWDVTTYETCLTIPMPQGCQRPEAVTFSPCGRYFVSGSSWQGTAQMSIRVWDVATGENIHTFWGRSTYVQDLAFSPDGTLLASASYDGTILLWDLKPYLPYESSRSD